MTESSKTVAGELATGDRLAALRAVADRLALALDDEDAPRHTLAPCAREMSRLLVEIEELERTEPGPTIAEALAEARAKREAAGGKVVRTGSR
jgi:hypothetical protein